MVFKDNLLEFKNPDASFGSFFLKTLLGSSSKIGPFDIFFKVLAEIQTIGMLLSFPFEVLQNEQTDSFGKFIEVLGKYISFNGIFKSGSTSWLDKLIWGLTLLYSLHLLVLVTIITLHHYRKTRISTKVRYFWNNGGIFHYNFLFLIVYQHSLSLANSNVPLFENTQASLYKGIETVHLIIHILFAFGFCRFLYEPLRTNYLAAKRTTIPDILTLVYKVLDPPITLLLGLSLQKWIRLSIIVVIFTLKLLTFFIGVPYYHYRILRLFFRFCFIELALVLASATILIVEQTKGISKMSFVYIAVIFVIFSIKIHNLIVKKKMKASIASAKGDFSSTKDFYWKLLALERTMEKGLSKSKSKLRTKEDETEVLFFAVLKNHRENCKKSECGCNLVVRDSEAKKKIPPSEKKEAIKLLKYTLVRDLYKEGTKKFPSNSELKIGLANLIYEFKDKSYAPSINLIHRRDKRNESFEMGVIAVKLLERIEGKLAMDYSSSVNVKQLIEYYELSTQLRNRVRSNMAKFLDFWETFKGQDPWLKKLYSINVSFNREAEEIKGIWENMVRQFPKYSYQDHLVYALYQSLARSAPHSAQKTLSKYFAFARINAAQKNKDSTVTSQNLHEPQNIVVSIAMKKERLGVVTFITGNIQEALNFKQSEVLNKNISMLMPVFFQEKHKKFLLAHTENSRMTIFNKNRQVFTRHKKGFIIPYTIYVTMTPYFQEQLLYVGILRPIKTFDEFILVLSDGTIDSFTENIGRVLNLNPKGTKRYRLRDISRELDKLHKAFLVFVNANMSKVKNMYARQNSSGLRAQGSFNTTGTGPNEIPSRNSRVSLVGGPEEGKKIADYLQTDPISGEIAAKDLVQLYEMFTTTGVNVKFNKYGEARSKINIDSLKELEYNTIIIEEKFLETHLRVYKIQTSSMNELLYDFDNESKSYASQGEKLSPSSPFDKKRLIVEKIEPESPANHNLLEVPSQASTSRNHAFKEFPKDNVQNEYGQGLMIINNKRNAVDDKHVIYEVKNDDSMSNTSKSNAAESNAPSDKSEDGNKKKNVKMRKLLQATKMVIGDNAEDGAGGTSVRSQLKDKVNAKIETAIYLNEKDPAIKTLILIIIVFCLGSLVMLLFCQTRVSDNLEGANRAIQIMGTSYNRLQFLIDLDRKMRMISLLQKGLAPPERHQGDYVIANLESIPFMVDGLLSFNTQLRKTIANLEDFGRFKFYAKAHPNKGGSGLRGNSSIDGFDFCTLIASSALELHNLLPNKPLANNSDLSFILDSSLNSIIIEGEEVGHIFQQEFERHLDKIKENIIVSLCVMCIMSIAIFIFASRTQLKLEKDKAYFLESFLMVKDSEVEHSINIVASLSNSLKENKKENKLMEELASEPTTIKLENTKKLEGRTFKAKKANLKGMANSTLCNLGAILVFLLFFSMIFVSLLVFYSTHTDKINDSKDEMVEVKTFTLNLVLTFTSLYEYIAENATTKIMNQPIDYQWEQIYSISARSNSFLSTFVNDNEPFNTKVKPLLNGNLCLTLFQNKSCNLESSSSVKNGILSINSYLIKIMRGIKDFFDSSDRSLTSIQATLVRKDLVDSEALFETYGQRAYTEFNIMLEEHFREDIEAANYDFSLFTILLAFVCVGLTIVLLCTVVKNMENERKNYRNFLRIIPVSVIMHNRYLKNYLFTHSKWVLDSVKHKI